VASIVKVSTLGNEDDLHNRKLLINSLIGMYGRRKNKIVNFECCDKTNLDEIGYAYQKLKKPFESVIRSDNWKNEFAKTNSIRSYLSIQS
jgi:hypothetical protein